MKEYPKIVNTCTVFIGVSLLWFYGWILPASYQCLAPFNPIFYPLFGLDLFVTILWSVVFCTRVYLGTGPFQLRPLLHAK